MNKPIIITLGGHSALEIALGAKKMNFKTAVVVQRGREKTYAQYYRHLFDRIIFLDAFHDLTGKKIFMKSDEKNGIFVPHRYVQVYCDMDRLEHNFPVKIFGNKRLLKYEERNGDFNQYRILREAGVDFPLQYTDPKHIDRLCIVKVQEAERGYERAFFFARNYLEYLDKSRSLIEKKKIHAHDLNKAVIEEYLIGTQINFNFFHSRMKNRLELLGTDARRQTNIDGFIRIPASIQEEIKDEVTVSYIETGHTAVTVKESLLEKAFEIGEKIVSASRTISPPGIIGPFAIQCAVVAGPPQERIVVYDLSLRMPGSPGIAYTPYSKYLFGENVSFGERITMEIKEAIHNKILDKIVT